MASMSDSRLCTVWSNYNGKKTVMNVTYSHKLGNIMCRYYLYNELSIIGHGIDVSCSVNSSIDIQGCSVGSLKIQGITWKDCNSITLEECGFYKGFNIVLIDSVHFIGSHVTIRSTNEIIIQNCTFINGSSLTIRESPVIYLNGNFFINNYINDIMRDQYEEHFGVLVKIKLQQQHYWHTYNNISITESTLTGNNVLYSDKNECPQSINISISDCHFKDNRGYYKSILAVDINELTSSIVTVANSVFFNNTG